LEGKKKQIFNKDRNSQLAIALGLR